MTVLITGFGPFPGAPRNPTGPLALRLALRRRPAFADTRRIAHVFPTSYAAVARDLPALVARHRPRAVVMFGLASRTKHVRIELRARNVASAVFADADRYKPPAHVLTQGAPSIIRVKAPAANLLAAARFTGVPARFSCDAGRYLCNALFWRALELSRRPNGPPVVAFVHVPLPERRVSVDRLSRAGEAILIAILAAGRRFG